MKFVVKSTYINKTSKLFIKFRWIWTDEVRETQILKPNTSKSTYTSGWNQHMRQFFQNEQVRNPCGPGLCLLISASFLLSAQADSVYWSPALCICGTFCVRVQIVPATITTMHQSWTVAMLEATGLFVHRWSPASRTPKKFNQKCWIFKVTYVMFLLVKTACGIWTGNLRSMIPAHVCQNW